MYSRNSLYHSLNPCKMFW